MNLSDIAWFLLILNNIYIIILEIIYVTSFQTVKLKFDFDFYGQTLNEITIASNGALLTGSKSAEIDLPNHIAPFLSNLPPSEDDRIIYTNDGMKYFVFKISLHYYWKTLHSFSIW